MISPYGRDEKKLSGRRRQLAACGAATAFGTQANSAIKIGLVGCGARGVWIGGMFQEFAGARITAMADVLRPAIAAAKEKLRSPEAREYVGLDAYRELAASDVDAVVIESPPYCHPEQAAAAVAAGKPVYLAKPAAVDVPGCQSILQAAGRAKGKTAFWIDFQYRARPVFQELARRVQAGDIGQPLLAQVYYYSDRLKKREEPSDSPAMARLRNWVFDKALSGDIIVEQNIHCLDAASWLIGARAISATGTGGRKLRVDVGDCWDHFAVNYEFPQGVKATFSSTQCTKGLNQIFVRILGEKGTAEAEYGGVCRIAGERPWEGATRDQTGKGGTIDNIKMFVASVQAGRAPNNATEAVESNVLAILGRTAAYRHGTATWDEVWNSRERLDPKLSGL